jgi:magnesium-transporting ATPase (P-type)
MTLKIQKILFIGVLLIIPFISLAQGDDYSYKKTNDSQAQIVAKIDKKLISNNENKSKNKLQKQHKKQYPFLNIVVVLSILYTVTYLLAKRKAIRMITHKKIWNILLTISFLVLAITSVLLILQINSGKVFSLGFDILYWHVIAGIIMMVITLFHMGWHWRYYKNLFK